MSNPTISTTESPRQRLLMDPGWRFHLGDPNTDQPRCGDAASPADPHFDDSRWPTVDIPFGILDTCGFPKDIFYYYQAWWREDMTVLHILPHWNWSGKEGQTIDVRAHSNCDEVELFLNGRSLGRQHS